MRREGKPDDALVVLSKKPLQGVWCGQRKCTLNQNLPDRQIDRHVWVCECMRASTSWRFEYLRKGIKNEENLSSPGTLPPFAMDQGWQRGSEAKVMLKLSCQMAPLTTLNAGCSFYANIYSDFPSAGCFQVYLTSFHLQLEWFFQFMSAGHEWVDQVKVIKSLILSRWRH